MATINVATISGVHCISNFRFLVHNLLFFNTNKFTLAGDWISPVFIPDQPYLNYYIKEPFLIDDCQNRLFKTSSGLTLAKFVTSDNSVFPDIPIDNVTYILEYLLSLYKVSI